MSGRSISASYCISWLGGSRRSRRERGSISRRSWQKQTQSSLVRRDEASVYALGANAVSYGGGLHPARRPEGSPRVPKACRAGASASLAVSRIWSAHPGIPGSSFSRGGRATVPLLLPAGGAIDLGCCRVAWGAATNRAEEVARPAEFRLQTVAVQFQQENPNDKPC